ncbi:response regulator [Pseudothermotoga thermarum]|uniref:Response regulator receiver protein n=1 Tax=Pseudothermotoga thermarum DSM 5069 TaxID=688269 RepID=F7YXN8_9THEM|nr:response regulator [Pseudothermotoga thermarum]AEH50682.1 response regulator receiver protein [Pseudothermotoga thermarum DSM 5069]
MAKKILVVDDSDVLRKIVVFNLQKEGYSVFEARNGVEALQLVEQIKPDLVILDVMMPEMDGFEVLRRLRSNPAYNSIFVIMLTAKGGEEDPKIAASLGANGFLTKPFSPVKLLEEVRRVVGE